MISFKNNKLLAVILAGVALVSYGAIIVKLGIA